MCELYALFTEKFGVDNTWVYNWDTHNLNLSSDIITVYALSEPRDLVHVIETNYATVGSYFYGALLSEDDINYLSGVPVSNISVVPYQYDLRDYQKVTDVKHQRSWGTCWAFSSYGSLESTLPSNEKFDFSEKNLVNRNGNPYTNQDSGGNAGIALAYLARWDGPVLEIQDHYPDPASGWSSSPENLPVARHVQDVLWIPGRANASDNNNLKWAIMNYGGGSVNFNATYFQVSPFWNNTTNSFYWDGSNPSNAKIGWHAVTIIGWDDTYSRYNFGKIPPGDGAFIIKNSWGQGWGDKGYCYISYYDVTLARNRNYIFTSEPTNNYDIIYQYDKLEPYTWDNKNWMANVFTSQSRELLSAISFYVYYPNTPYEIYIYKNPTNGPLSELPHIHYQNGTIDASGYRTVELTKSILLDTNDRFSVVVKLSDNNQSNKNPIGLNYWVNTPGHPGESYISDDGSNWTAYSQIYSNANICLKAFTKIANPDIKFIYLSPISDKYIGDLIEISGGTNLNDGTPLSITLQTNFSSEKIWKYCQWRDNFPHLWQHKIPHLVS